LAFPQILLSEEDFTTKSMVCLSLRADLFNIQHSVRISRVKINILCIFRNISTTSCIPFFPIKNLAIDFLPILSYNETIQENEEENLWNAS